MAALLSCRGGLGNAIGCGLPGLHRALAWCRAGHALAVLLLVVASLCCRIRRPGRSYPAALDRPQRAPAARRETLLRRNGPSAMLVQVPPVPARPGGPSRPMSLARAMWRLCRTGSFAGDLLRCSRPNLAVELLSSAGRR